MTLNKITLTFFKEQLEIFNATDGVSCHYKVTEIFSPSHNYSYNISNLNCDIEDGQVFFSGDNDLIYKNDLNVLIGFMVDRILDISHKWLYREGENYTAIITLPDGIIYIERIYGNIDELGNIVE